MKIDDLHPYVAPFVPDKPIPVLDQHIRTAANTFFAGTHAWQLQLDPQTTVDGQLSYELDAGKGVEIVKVLEVLVGEDDYSKAVELDGDGVTLWFPSDNPPRSNQALSVTVAIAPAVQSLTQAWTLPDAMARYASDIAQGALSSLLAMPGGDVAEAGRRAIKFSDRINTVGIQISRSRTRSRLTRTAAANFY